MDVNVAEINTMDEDKRKKLLAERRCFYCEKQGHVTWSCFKKRNTAGAHTPAQGNGTGRQGMAACTADVDRRETDEELAKRIQEMKEGDRDTFFDKILGF
jgi:hypothetical protein